MGIGFVMTVGLFSALAAQGSLPFMSPDETATFVTAQTLAQTGRLTVTEPRGTEFPWLHPRSFVAQQGVLMPVSFPLWGFLLGMVAMIHAGSVLWVAVLLSASFVVALSLALKRALGFSSLEAVVVALAVVALPTMLIYGNRSLFGLVPQLALVGWAVWLSLRARTYGGSALAGAFTALAVAIRPVEAVWIVPGILAIFCWKRERFAGAFIRAFIAWLIGFCLVVAVIAGLHAWVYGSPFAVGYFLRDLPARPNPLASVVSEPVARWRAFFPYGFSLRQAWDNVRGMWGIGWWPWILTWAGATLFWLLKRRPSASRAERFSFLGVCLLTLWLGFYYGQGRYADHIGGQPFHLGSSLFRYLTPAFVAWTVWVFWVTRESLPQRLRKGTIIILASVHVIGGILWAYHDPVDGILQNRHERQTYAEVRAIVERESASSTIWLSDRSDKIAFPVRAATSPLPAVGEIRRFLQARTQPVWIYRRPPSQAERDAWRAEGLELIERQRFEREMIYEVRLRAGY